MSYDALASDPTVYAYADGNPVSNTDPLGLLVGNAAAWKLALERAGLAEAVGGGPEDPLADVAAVVAVIGTVVAGVSTLPPEPSAAGGGGTKPPVPPVATGGCPPSEPSGPNPLRRIHSNQTLTSGSNRYGYESLQQLSTQQIIDSLAPGAPDPLLVRPDGSIFDGNTRTLILEQRGIDVNTLPRTILP